MFSRNEQHSGRSHLCTTGRVISWFNFDKMIINRNKAREVLERDRDGRDDLYVLALFRQGQALLRQGKTLTAMEAFIAALDISPDNERVRSEITRLEEE